MRRQFDRCKPARSKLHSIAAPLFFVVVAVLLVTPCIAHPGYPASAIVQVQSDGLVLVHVRHDALAFALNETPERIADDPMRQLLMSPRDELAAKLDEGRLRFVSLFELKANDQPLEVELLEWPTVELIESAPRSGSEARLPIMLEFVARLHLSPDGTHFTLKFPEVLGALVMVLERPGFEPFSLPLRAGEQSPEFALHSRSISVESVIANTEVAKELSSLNISARYALLGFEHIVPRGLDHMLFVLALFLLSIKLSDLLAQITLFTLAHSVTLALATLDVARLPAEIIEPVIAASIALVAAENVLTTRVHSWRLIIVFAFGLVHGMGFAGVLSELGLPKTNLLPALVSFNVGVELGQLAVIGIAIALVGWWRSRLWYRHAIAVPASALIGLIGICWTLQRCLNS